MNGKCFTVSKKLRGCRVKADLKGPQREYASMQAFVLAAVLPLSLTVLS